MALPRDQEDNSQAFKLAHVIPLDFSVCMSLAHRVRRPVSFEGMAYGWPPPRGLKQFFIRVQDGGVKVACFPPRTPRTCVVQGSSELAPRKRVHLSFLRQCGERDPVLSRGPRTQAQKLQGGGGGNQAKRSRFRRLAFPPSRREADSRLRHRGPAENPG